VIIVPLDEDSHGIIPLCENDYPGRGIAVTPRKTGDQWLLGRMKRGGRENHVPQVMAIEKKPMDMTGSMRKKILRLQIERFLSVRTILLKLNNTPL